ncbi:glycoside hydrolase family 16 protein [Schizophyllum commune Loenen D]|nr:glycoside hydrolase family 16 protein [Schizophyllum commune Loenen D]
MKYIAVLSSLIALSSAKLYSASERYVGNTFYDAFEFQAVSDPTHGRVNYVDMWTAQGRNLTFTTGMDYRNPPPSPAAHLPPPDDTFILRTDCWSTLSPSGPGRDSVRIQSKNLYKNHLAVFNVRHMPQGCGTWPAIWYADVNNWPGAGEIDVLEGVNNVTPDASTLHTTAGCTMPDNRGMFGSPTQSDCNHDVNGNAGCGVRMNNGNSFGPNFNAVGGGWFVMERTDDAIRVWFWERNDPNVPASIKNRQDSLLSEELAEPQALFPNTNCDFNSHFGPLRIIINLTICGDWAGSTFNNDGCPGSCIDLANNNPSAFGEAYFDIASIDLYT